jgi:hypothetical protein
MIYRGFIKHQDFSPPYDLAPPPTPAVSRQQVVSLSKTSYVHVSQVEPTDGRGREGVGEEPNHTTSRKPGPLLIVQYSLL